MSDFLREAAVMPVAIGDMAIELFDPQPQSGQNQRGTVTVQIRLSDGSVRVRRFNLADHVGAQTITQLQALAASLRAKAVAEILPE